VFNRPVGRSNLAGYPPAMNEKEQALVVDSLVVMLNREYVFPEKAKEMASLLKKNLEDGIYKKYTDPISSGTRSRRTCSRSPMTATFM